MTNSNYYIWLQQALGAGAVTDRIFSFFSSPEEIFMSDEKALKLSGVFSARQIEKLKKTDIEKTYEILSVCGKEKVDVITPDTELYPKRLLEIRDFPLVLYTRGDMTCFKNKIPVAVVGTRKASELSRLAAEKLSRTLSSSGFLIVSGGALGIDSAAHTGAIASGGKTVCVLGCGIGSSYLSENEPLRRAVSKNGVLVSEHPPLLPPARGSFPVRNRIIAGLCEGTVVIEAGVKSGSLITARYANEMGRDVFAVPSDLLGTTCTGTRELIRDGAKTVRTSFDVLEEYLVRFPGKIIIDEKTDLSESITAYGVNAYPDLITEITEQIKKDFKKSDTPVMMEEGVSKEAFSEEKIPKKRVLSEEASYQASKVYEVFDYKQKTVNEIMAEVNLPANEIFGALTELELLGYIAFLPNTKYKLI